MAGLFNANTQLEALLEQQRQRNVAQQREFGELFGNAASNRRQAASNTVGAQIGAAFGQGLAGGLFGDSEQIQQARRGVEEEQQVQQQLGRFDPDDPVSLETTGAMLIQQGLPEAGMRLRQQASEVRAQQEASKVKTEGLSNVGKFLQSKGAPPELQTAVRAGTVTPKDAMDFIAEPEQTTVGLGRFTTPDGSTVSGGFTKDKHGNAVVKIFDDNGDFVPAPAGTVPELQEGQTIVFSDLDRFKNMQSLVGTYNSETKDLKERTDQLQMIATSLNTGIKQDTQAALARVFGNKIRSNKELEEWAGVGRLDERIINGFNRFLGGDYSDANKDIVEDLIVSSVIESTDNWNRINNRYNDRAVLGQISPNLVITNDFGFPNFLAMDREELKNIDVEALSPIEEKLLRKSLQRIVGRQNGRR